MLAARQVNSAVRTSVWRTRRPGVIIVGRSGEQVDVRDSSNAFLILRTRFEKVEKKQGNCKGGNSPTPKEANTDDTKKTDTRKPN